MWLLKVKTRELVSLLDDRQAVGKYAILSHTWDEDEVTFADIHTPAARDMKGYQKIEYTCRQAENDGLEFAWVDTCCINKDSSAELSEAINAMYRWYQNSAVCYVYLADVSIEAWSENPGGLSSIKDLRKILPACRWLTRGWTLQEMIAPSRLVFYDRHWSSIKLTSVELGNREMLELLGEMTEISPGLLRKERKLESYPLAQRLSWAARRETTRVEDAAYSLLGLLGVNMPLLYGEGTKAFTRLQEEILKSSTDYSVLLWQPHRPEQMNLLVAPNCFCFRDIKSDRDLSSQTNEGDSLMTNRGMRITLLIEQLATTEYVHGHFATPYQSHAGDKLLLRRIHRVQEDTLSRCRETTLIPAFEIVRALVSPSRSPEFVAREDSQTWKEIIISRDAQSWTYTLDLDKDLKVFSVNGMESQSDVTELLLTPAPWRLNNIVIRQASSKAEHVLLSKDSQRSSVWWKGGRGSSKNISSHQVLRVKTWGAQDGMLPGLKKEFPPRTLILRVWVSHANATDEEVGLASLPTTDGISRLWTIAASEADVSSVLEQNQQT